MEKLCRDEGYCPHCGEIVRQQDEGEVREMKYITMDEYKRVKKWNKKLIYNLVQGMFGDEMPDWYYKKSVLLTMIPVWEIIVKNKDENNYKWEKFNIEV